MSQLLPIAEVLFVFNQWTLMMNSKYSDIFDKVNNIRLYDKDGVQIGIAKAVKFLPSKNPEIVPVVIELSTTLERVKEVKFISTY